MIHIPAFLGAVLNGAIRVYDRFSGRRNRRIAAAAAFREAVLKELQDLYPNPANWPKATGIEQRLRKSFPALQSAVAAFRPYVPEKDRASFDEAWMYYHTETKRPKDQTYTHYMNITNTSTTDSPLSGGQHTEKNNGKENFRRNADRLLSFAQEV
jgi:hypothetical protein